MLHSQYKQGRPRVHKNPVWFGMKIEAEQRELIRKLAKNRGKSATQAIMELVEKSVGVQKIEIKRLSAAGIMKLAPAERKKILLASAKKAAKFYETDSDLVFPDSQDIIEY